jgi:hypothetical protein
MVSDRALKLFVIAVVLAAAWYAGRQTVPGMVIPVAIVGLATTLWRAVLGVPVASGMVAAAVYVPGVAIGAMFVVVLLAIIAAFVRAALGRAALGLGPGRTRTASPTDASVFYLGYSDGGGFDGGGCDGGF